MWANNDDAETSMMNHWSQPSQGMIQMQHWSQNNRAQMIRLSEPRAMPTNRQYYDAPSMHLQNSPWQATNQAAVVAASGGGQHCATQWPANNALPPSHAVNAGVPPQVWQQWGTVNPSGAATYADHAKKNMVSINTNRVQSVAPGRFEPNQNWSNKIDQPGAWESSARGVAAVSIETKSEWSGIIGNRWNAAQWGPQSGSNEWNSRNEPVPWNSARPIPPAPIIAPAAVTTNPWPQNPQQLPAQVEQLDINPQTPGPWVPQPSELNNDLMWHDPNPKQKKVARDNGTSIWGEPCSQQGIEIRRWKEPEAVDMSHIQSGATCGGDWEAIAVTAATSSTTIITPSTDSVSWAEVAAAPAVRISEQAERWTAPQQQPNWIDQTKVEDVGDNAGIAEMLRKLSEKGLIDGSLSTMHLTSHVQSIVNHMYSKMIKLDHLQKQWQQASQLPQKNQTERLIIDIQALKSELTHLKDSLGEQFMKNSAQSINGIVAFNANDGQSRLNQWKQANIADLGAEKLNTSTSETNIQTLISGTSGLAMEDKGDWRAGALEWSNNVCVGRGNEDAGEAKEEAIVAIAEKAANSLSHTPEEIRSPVDDGPPEFVPGKKWVWRDPNKIAEDPNAKPGDLKPNPLLSSSSTTALQSGNKFYSNDMQSHKNWTGQQDVWGSNRMRPVFGQQSFQPRMPIGQQNFMRPMSNQHHSWITININSPADQDIILYRCAKFGSVLQFLTNGNALYIRFNEPAEVVLPRLKAEISSKMKITTDADLERNLKFFNPSIVPINVNAGWGATLVNNGELQWPYHGPGQLPADMNTNAGNNFPYC